MPSRPCFQPACRCAGPGPELVAGLSQGQGRGWGLGCRPGECSLGRGSPAPAAHFPPWPRAERLTGSALLLRPRERAGPRGSALRTDLENRRTRCVCETETARRPWSNPEGRWGTLTSLLPPELQTSSSIRPWSQSQGDCERTSKRSTSLENDKETWGPAHVLIDVDETHISEVGSLEGQTTYFHLLNRFFKVSFFFPSP